MRKACLSCRESKQQDASNPCFRHAADHTDVGYLSNVHSQKSSAYYHVRSTMYLTTHIRWLVRHSQPARRGVQYMISANHRSRLLCMTVSRCLSSSAQLRVSAHPLWSSTVNELLGLIAKLHSCPQGTHVLGLRVSRRVGGDIARGAQGDIWPRSYLISFWVVGTEHKATEGDLLQARSFARLPHMEHSHSIWGVGDTRTTVYFDLLQAAAWRRLLRPVPAVSTPFLPAQLPVSILLYSLPRSIPDRASCHHPHPTLRKSWCGNF